MQSHHPNLVVYHGMGYRMDLLTYLRWSESFLTLHQLIQGGRTLEEVAVPKKILRRAFLTDVVILGMDKFALKAKALSKYQRCEEYLATLKEMQEGPTNGTYGSGRAMKCKSPQERTLDKKNNGVRSSLGNEKRSLHTTPTMKCETHSSDLALSTSSSEKRSDTSSPISSEEEYGQRITRKKARLSQENEIPIVFSPSKFMQNRDKPIKKVAEAYEKRKDDTKINRKLTTKCGNCRRCKTGRRNVYKMQLRSGRSLRRATI